MVERPDESLFVEVFHPAAVVAVGGLASLLLLFEHAGGESRSKRESNQHRDENRDGHGPAELIQEAFGVTANEGDGDEDDDERQGGRDDGEGNLFGCEEGCFLRLHVCLVEHTVDVLDDDDGVIDDYTYG